MVDQGVHNFSPVLKEAWAMHTVKNEWSRPILLEFNDWLKEKAKTHEMMGVTSLKPQSYDNSTTITKTRTALKVFASTSKADESNVGRSALPKPPVKCTARKLTHPLWRWPVFRGKTPTQTAKVVADNKLCFSSPNGQHSFRQCPRPSKRSAEGSSSSHNVFLHGAEKVFPPGPLSRQNNTTKSSSVPMKKESRGSSCVVSQTDVKGLLQISEILLQSPTRTETVLALSDSASNYSWISETLAEKLLVQGTATKITVHGSNS